jgi:hypothetical protein
MKRKAAAIPEKALSQVAGQQLALLEGVLQEIGRTYVSRLQREIRSVAGRIKRAQEGGELTRRQIRDLKEMLQQIGDLHLKPEKGRRKDLKKIDALIGTLDVLVENW